MRTLHLLLIGALLLGCATTVTAPPVEQTVFERVCDALEVDCSFIDAPIVVVTQTVADLPCLGCFYRGFTYPGEDYVFVNATMAPLMQWKTEFHETIHYVHFQLSMNVTRCESEMIARKLTALEFNDEYDDSWLKPYRCNADGTEIAREIFPDYIERIIRRVKGD